MLSREPVGRYADPRLVRRQHKQWFRAFRGGVEHGPKYEYPCWVCGEIGEIGVDGFGSKSMLIRPRNIQHQECWDSVDPATRSEWMHRDRKVIIRRADRRRSKRNYDREAIRQRKQHGTDQWTSTTPL